MVTGSKPVNSRMMYPNLLALMWTKVILMVQEAELPYNFRASPLGAFKKDKSGRVKVKPMT